MAEAKNGDAKGPASRKYQVDPVNFGKRLNLLYACWKDHKEEHWGGAEVLSLVTPPPSEDLRYMKSSALQIWLLGYEFPETIMVFMQNQIHVLCSEKKAQVLQELPKQQYGVNLVIHVKSRSDDGTGLMQTMLHAMTVGKKPVVGWLSKEAPEGPLMETWVGLLNDGGFNLVDISAGLSEIFAVKEEPEIQNIRKAAFLCASVLNVNVVPKLELIIDHEKQVTHAELMDETEKVVYDPSKVKVKLKAENVDICYPPIFQSGGVFDLRPSAISNEESLYYEALGVIVCAIGAKYNSYCANIARTYLIDADALQSKAYIALQKAHEAAINALRPGNRASAVYKAALAVMGREGPEFIPQLTKTSGTGIGIEFRESGLTLNNKNDRILKAGMVFNASLGLQNLHIDNSQNPKTQNFSLLLADTVVIKEKGPEVATSSCSKSYNDIAYSFKDEEEEEQEKPTSKLPSSNGTDPHVVKLRSDDQEMTKEELRRQHQAELARQKNEETARRLASGGLNQGDRQGVARTTGDLVAYKNVDDIPFSRELMIHVDQKNESVLLPVYGLMVPFHIATVKSVISQQDGGHSYIRIIFNVPGSGYTTTDVAVQKFPGAIYLKEVSFRSSDVRHSNQVVQLIKTLRRQVALRESEKAERATLVIQEKLQLTKAKPTRLPDLWIRPAFGGKGRKLSGTLEAHANGFRYATMKPDERVDIMYSNIKHAFFQPAEREMITLLHFHLHNFIMVGNKKTKDVQFFVEVMDVVQTLGSGRRSTYDPDEIEEEQQERDRKNKVNMEFNTFVKRAQELWEQPQFKDMGLEFDVPFRELGFHGVPHKAAAFIVPTVNCLVELIEQPFLVVTLNDIEIVNLERVGLGQKAFDMTIVFKDFQRDVLRIDVIPSTSLDGIKEWMNSMNIKYYESRMNLNWRPILKTILDDPEKFIEDGGWEFLNMEVSDSDSENSEESDEGYQPSDVEVVSESEDEDSDDESVVESEDDDEEEEDSEEEGMTWDELEAEARKEDKEKEDESDSEDDRRRRKAKAAGKARVSDVSRQIPSKRSKVR